MEITATAIMKGKRVTSHAMLDMLCLGHLQEHVPVLDGLELILSVMVCFKY